MEQQFIDLGIKLSEALVKNTASAVFTKAKRDVKETLSKLK